MGRAKRYAPSVGVTRTFRLTEFAYSQNFLERLGAKSSVTKRSVADALNSSGF